MKPHPFDYLRADSVDEAIKILAEHGDTARVLAGGRSLLALLNLRLLEPAMLLDITGIPDLVNIREVDGKVEVGAAVTQNRLLAWPGLKEKLPLLAAALPFVGHFQTRNKGTVCGSVAHADPSSEIPLSLAMLQGEVILRSLRGTRTVPASEFQVGMLTTARKPDELVDVDIEISVLSPLERIENPLDIELGKHGIDIQRGYAHGCFLPQVATETGWSREEFLGHCCRDKAGLAYDAWKDPKTEVRVFTAEVFGEKE